MSPARCFSRGLVGLALFLAITACTNQRPRPNIDATEVPAAPGAPVQTGQIPLEPKRASPAEVTARSPWERLRARFVMGGCAYSESVPREAYRYTRSPEHFNASWQQAMPALLLVLGEIERRDLPGEFALLPYIESHYRSLPARNNGPAGIWQLMSHTASDQGLQVTRDYDQRLDLLASTHGALGLIERYDREFSDWRLADMAFNAGEFRVKRALGAIPAGTLDAQRLSRLKLAATTHQHLIRLLALSCIVSEPERFGVELPAENADERLAEVILPSAIDLRLAASLTGLNLADVIRMNAAWAGQAPPRGPAKRLLLPAPFVDRLNLALKDFPADKLGSWHTQKIEVATTLVELAPTVGVNSRALAAANRIDETLKLVPGKSLLLPGAEPAKRLPDNGDFHSIKSGDTLSAIARRYQIRLEDLLRWNELTTRSILRTGSTLRIHAGPN